MPPPDAPSPSPYRKPAGNSIDKGNTRPTTRARELRANPTEAQKRLWGVLSARKVAGVRFNRQFAIGPYICDFVSRAAKLVVEADGGQHGEATDAARTQLIESQGYRVIRFWNHDILANTQGVVAEIERVLRDMPSLNLSRQREGSLKRQLADAEGRRGEDYAAAWLERRGWTILDRRVRTAAGEVDLVARRDTLIAFVEVKVRRTAADLDHAIDEPRLARVAAAAELLMPRYAEPGDDIRVDVILLAPGTLPRHIENAWIG